MKCGSRKAVLDCPIHRPSENALVIVVHPEDEAAVDHDPELVKAVGDCGVVTPQVLPFVAPDEIAWRKRLETHEETPQPHLGSALDDVTPENRINSRSSLKEALHSAHPVKQGCGKTGIAKEVIVEKVEMASWQSIDFGKCIIDLLRVKRTATLEKGILVAEVTVLRTAARHHD
jgi:hypothetical protein